MNMVINKAYGEYLDIKQICAALGRDEILVQTTEECCELGQACQKARRAYNGTTPVSIDSAIQKLNEEVGDVLLLIDCLVDIGLVDLKAAGDSRRKIYRWHERTFKKVTDT